MGVDKSLVVAGRGHRVPQQTGVTRKRASTKGVNYGTADLRMNAQNTQVITLNSFAGTDSFKIRVFKQARVARGAQYRESGAPYVDTAAFVRGTNATAAAIQAELRTATGDATLTVAGNTDAGPFTVTFVGMDPNGYAPFALVSLSGCSGNVTFPAVTYIDATGHAATANQTASTPGTTNLVGIDAPLGTSVRDYDGTVLIPPDMVSAVGGSGQVVIDTTEQAGGGTVLFAIRSQDETGADYTRGTPADIRAGKMVVVDSEDADGDATITGLSAGDYELYYHTQTALGRVSRSGPAEFFTVT